MKTIDMTELNVGDIFCHELKLHGREAFEVTEIKQKSIFCKSRKTGDVVKKQYSGNVILLKQLVPKP